MHCLKRPTRWISLQKKRVENNGEVPQYYVEESRPDIIDKEMWDAVQLEMEIRKAVACEI